MKRYEDLLTLSTLLTLFRIVLVPCIMVAIFVHAWSTALYLFVIAGISDLLDGAFARLFNESTFIGACLDPVADKLLVLGTYLSLAVAGLPSYVAPGWLISFLLVKDALLIAGGFYGGIIQGTISVRSGIWGKLAMCVQMAALGFILLVLLAGKMMPTCFKVLHYAVFYTSLMALAAYIYEGLGGVRVWYTIKKSLEAYLYWS